MILWERDTQEFPMDRSVKIIRRSIYIFLQNYQSFTLSAAFIALPFAALCLLSEASVPSLPLFGAIHNRLLSLFDAAGFPRSADLFMLLNLNLSQTIATSFIALPFSLTFLLLAKAFVIQVLYNTKDGLKSKHVCTSFFSIYRALLLTQHCNILVLISANATCFCLLFFAFTCLDIFGFLGIKSLIISSAAGPVFYSIILANALVICNLALIVSGMEKRGGYLSILKAFVLMRGRAATAISLALFVNILLALVEALFHYRIAGAYQNAAKPFSFVVLESIFIAYLYSILLVLDTVIGCTFYRSCKATDQIDQDGRFCYAIGIKEGDGVGYVCLKTLEELP